MEPGKNSEHIKEAMSQIRTLIPSWNAYFKYHRLDYLTSTFEYRYESKAIIRKIMTNLYANLVINNWLFNTISFFRLQKLAPRVSELVMHCDNGNLELPAHIEQTLKAANALALYAVTGKDEFLTQSLEWGAKAVYNFEPSYISFAQF